MPEHSSAHIFHLPRYIAHSLVISHIDIIYIECCNTIVNGGAPPSFYAVVERRVLVSRGGMYIYL